MSSTSNTRGIITNGLGLHIDIEDKNSWKTKNEYISGSSEDLLTVYSINKLNDIIIDDIELKDGELVGYDVGRSNKLAGATQVIRYEDQFISLRPVGYNPKKTLTSKNLPVQYNLYPISATTFDYFNNDYVQDSYTQENRGGGDYFKLNGGYLNGYFKLEGYNYELFPYRYNNGFTFETWLRFDENTFSPDNKPNDGIFLFIGTRAENKYSTLFTGTTNDCTYEKTINHTNCGNGEIGINTSENNNLGSDHSDDLEKNIYYNVIAFIIDNNGRVGYKYIDNNGKVKQEFSSKPLSCTSEGWYHISGVFKPDNVIFDDNLTSDEDKKRLLECSPRRKGTLSIYVNGFKFYDFENVDEFFFKGMDTEKEKQIGLPYNISWGGGTFGLKHSYHFDPYWQNKFINNFTYGDNGKFFNNIDGLSTLGTNQLLNSLDENTNGVGIGQIGSTFIVGGKENVVAYQGVSSLKIYNNEGIGNSIINNNINPLIIGGYRPLENLKTLFETTKTVNIKPFSKYKISAWINTENSTIFKDKKVGNYLFDFIEFDVTSSNNTSFYTQSFTKIDENWQFLELVFITNNNFTLDDYTLRLKVDTSNTNFNRNFQVYVDLAQIEEYYWETEIYNQDVIKNNLLIEKHFDGSFKGGIQQLRLYVRPLSFKEIQTNFNIDANKFGYKRCKNSGRQIYI